MAQLLWGLGKLVNDPTTALFQEVKFRVFGNQIDISAENEPNCSTSTGGHPQSIHPINEKPSSSVKKSSKACDTRDLSDLKEVESKGIQVNFERRKHRQVSIQCQKSNAKACKSTSMTNQIHHLDRSTGESQVVEKKDRDTRPRRMKLCQGHYEVLLLLQDWEAVKHKYKAKKLNKFGQFKETLSRMVKTLKVEKIGSLSPYIPPSEQIMNLYKRESLDLIKKRRVQYPKNIVCELNNVVVTETK